MAHELQPGPSGPLRTSVHIVLKVMLPDDADEPQFVFAEIQLRSLFEEAWSEISHRLRYGPDKSAAASGPPEGRSPPPPGRWRRHLDALKSLADGCAQYSDLIAEEAAQELAGRTQSLRDKAQSFEGGKNLYTDFPRDLLPDLNAALGRRNRAEQMARSEGAKAAEGEFMAAARNFEQLLSDLLGRQGRENER
jgi:hypothetical protein